MELWGFENNEDTFYSLVKSYSEKGRHYHTGEHVDACLYQFDKCKADIEQPREVEIALWFHDAIYKPLGGGNERKSADWASAFLSDSGATREESARVHRLIMVTEHNAPTQTRDESMLVDIDLSILGTEPETYETFEKAVRKEYKQVPMFIYRKKRIEILDGFLKRDQIYQNEPFLSSLEQQARENLSRAISRLK